MATPRLTPHALPNGNRMQLEIGNLVLPSRLILSPLAGVSDLPFRLIARGHGCRFAFAEMISARALARESARTVRMLRTSPGDRPLGIQLLGADPEIAARAAEFALAWRPDLLDINAACPVRKVVQRGEGAALLKDPRLLAAVLRAVASRSPVPVTVKLRCGWSAASPPAREIALRAREAGAAAVFIHGRTMRQGYSGAVDYAAIRSVKEALDIPVVASGDALTPPLVKKLLDETGCDGALIARGALGNPWIFREAEAFLWDGTVPPRPGPEELASVMSRHLALCCGHYTGGHGVKVFRKHFAWYTRGLSGMKPFRERAFAARTQAEMDALIEAMRNAPPPAPARGGGGGNAEPPSGL